MPIAYVYMSFLLRSIFLALNTSMHWTYQGKEITNMPEDVVGFVYLITNTTNGRMYIGKKLAKFKRSRPPLKGRKNKRRYKVHSDWQDYYGSSDDLGFRVAEKPVHIHDLQATLLYQLGFDHTKLTHRFQGRDFRLTDVHGEVVHDLLS